MVRNKKSITISSNQGNEKKKKMVIVLPYIILVVDEFADLIMTAEKK
jgi:DNA segregation ATPase FtsK/SpoIIIE-like protein